MPKTPQRHRSGATREPAQARRGPSIWHWIVAILLLSATSGPAATAGVDNSARPDWRELRSLLERGEYSALESRLAGYQADFEAGTGSEWSVAEAYASFATSDAKIAAGLDAWLAKRPDSLPAHVARGVQRRHLAHIFRGEDVLAETHPDRLAEMNRLHSLATDDLSWAVAHSPRSTVAHAALITIAQFHGDEDRVDRLFEAARQAVPHSAVVLDAYLWAITPWWRGYWGGSDAALQTIRETLAEVEEQAGDRPDLRRIAGFADHVQGVDLTRTGDYEAALAALSRALEASETAGRYIYRGMVHNQLMRHDLAVADLRRAVEIAPSNANAWYRLSYVVMNACEEKSAAGERPQCDPEEPLRSIDRAIELDPLNPDYLLWKARLLSGDGRDAEARTDLDNALVYGHLDADVYDTIAAVLRSRHGRAAADALRQAVALAPNEERRWRYFGNYVHTLVGDGDCSAIKLLNEYIELCDAGARCELDGRSPLQSLQHRVGHPCGEEFGPTAKKLLPMPNDVVKR